MKHSSCVVQQQPKKRGGGRGERASQFGTRAIGELYYVYYDDVPAELICSGRERESRKYGEKKKKKLVLLARRIYICLRVHRLLKQFTLPWR